MESVLPPLDNSSVSLAENLAQAKAEIDIQLIQSSEISTSQSDTDDVSISFSDLYKGLSVSAKQLIDKLNELLKADLPNGIQSLKPEDVTPEATADRIVTSVTAFFDSYAKQNPDLEGEELLNAFLDEVSSGITKGYDDAYQTLEGLGAFDYGGVRSGVEETKRLIEAKLAAFETQKRKELGLDPEDDVEAQSYNAAFNSTLAQGGANSISVIA